MNSPQPAEEPPDLYRIAFEAEMQCARTQAIVHELAEAAPDADSGKYIWEAVEYLLAPVLSNLCTLTCELYPRQEKDPQPPKGEGARPA